MKPIFHDPEAKSDAISAARFYDERVMGLGARLLKALDVAILKIARNPQLYAFCEKPIRSCRVNGFPYRVLFCRRAGVCAYSSGFAPGTAGWLVALSS